MTNQIVNRNYIVVPFHGNKFCTDNLKEAEEIYIEMCQSCEFVELLFGEPGHYETLRQSW